MAYSECLPTRLNPLAETTCFSQVIRAAGGWFEWQAARLTGALQRLAFAACFSDRATGLALPGGGPASAAELGARLGLTPTEILFDLVWCGQPPAGCPFNRCPLGRVRRLAVVTQRGPPSSQRGAAGGIM